MTNLNVESVTGKEPNQAFTRGGFALLILSAVAYLGLSGFGIELGDHSELSPLVTMALAVYLMTYGGYLKKIQTIEKQKHEIRLAEAKTHDHHEPKKGDVEFLEFIKSQPLPISKHELSELTFPYDSGRTKAELLKALLSKRASWWVCEGSLTEYGDAYNVKGSDMTVIK